MCGYAGVMFNQGSIFSANPNYKDLFFSAASHVKHRGNEPLRKVELENILLAHYRLAFLDAATNIQPMLSKNKKWVIVFNGEIYNHSILRKKIIAEQGYNFTTKGDTEAILEGFLNYGLEIEKYLDGEYSFVICKTDGTELIAMRDPFGVKPLFFGLEDIQTNIFANAQESYLFKSKSLQFASEIKGLAIEKKWHREGFLRQLTGLYDPIRTPYQNIIQLPPNSYLYAKKQNDYFVCKIQLKKESIRPIITDNELNQDELLHEFKTTLSKSVAHRMLSDIELGVYLSGGVDSRVVAYEMLNYLQHKKITRPLKSFTISFENEEYNEATEALSFAQKYGIVPNILRVSNQNLSYAYKHAIYHAENIHPYTNCAAKWWLSKFTGRYVKGVLTGDGADELLGGYPSFKYANWWKFALSSVPGTTVFDKMNKLTTETTLHDSNLIKKLTPEKDPWLAGSSVEGTGEDFIASLRLWGVAHPLFSQIKTIASAVLGNDGANKWLAEQKESVRSWFSFGYQANDAFLSDPMNALALWQNYFCKTHLPVQVLNVVGDRMEMANTVEGRTPFLSREMKKIVKKMKDSMLIRGYEDKSILRRSYSKKIGQNFAMAPKKQFGAPFLFNENLIRSYQEVIISKIKENQLFETKNTTNLFEFMNSDFSKKKASPHLLTQLNSAFQSLICFTILDDTLIKNSPPRKEEDYEEKVLSQKII